MRALDYASEQLWAIRPEWLPKIIEIAARENEAVDIQALAAKLGRPLDNTHSVEMRDGVAVIPVIGPMFRYANIFSDISGGTSTESLAHDFNAAVSSPQVSGVMLTFDTPGGAAKGINELSHMIHDARGKKPIVAYVGNEAASAGYWIATAAQSVIVEDTALLGSIGVVATFRKKGADVRNIEIVSTQSPYKRDTPETDEGKQRIQAMVDSLAEIFVERVAQNMGVSTDKVLSDFGKGGLMSGRDAVAAGMAHGVGSYEGVIAEMKSKRAGKSYSLPIAAKTTTKENSLMAMNKEDQPTADPNIDKNRVPSPVNPNENPETKPGPTEGKDVPGVDPTPERPKDSPTGPVKRDASASVDIQAQMSALESKLRGEFEAKAAALRAETETANTIAAQERELRISADYAKRAEKEFPGMPGKAEEKGAALRAAESLPEAQRKPLLEMLRSGNSAISSLMRERGTSLSPESSSAKAAFESKVQEIAARDKISIPKASAVAMNEHKDLYMQSVREKN